jgi:hypothetical protein
MNDLCVRELDTQTGAVTDVFPADLKAKLLAACAAASSKSTGTETVKSSSAGPQRDAYGVAMDAKGRLLFSCMEAHTILRYDPSPSSSGSGMGSLEVLAGQPGVMGSRDGRGDSALLGDLGGICFDPADTLFVCDTAHDAIRAVDTASGFVYTLTSYKQAYTPVAFPFQVGSPSAASHCAIFKSTY